jgi:hypothetical protein
MTLLREDGTRHGFWSEAPCTGCTAPLNTTDPLTRLCAACSEAVLEGLAVRLDPSYDRTRMNDAGRCFRALWGLYGAPEGWDKMMPPWQDWRPE